MAEFAQRRLFIPIEAMPKRVIRLFWRQRTRISIPIGGSISKAFARLR